MVEVFKVLNEALAAKDRQIEWLTEDKRKAEEVATKALAEAVELRAEAVELKKEIENLRGDLEFYKPKGSAN